MAFAATESPNVARGFQPERSFELGEIDHVNAFNGNLIVSIPIGPVYAVSPQLSFQFRLTWNSNVWDGDEGSVVGTTASYTNRASNAGLRTCWSPAGGIQAIHVISATYLNPGDEALIPDPEYSAYADSVSLFGGTPVFFPLKADFHVDFEAMEKRITPRTKIVFISSPGNPTGRVLREEEILGLARLAVRKCERAWQILHTPRT